MQPWTAVTQKDGIPQLHAIAGGFFCEYVIIPNNAVSHPFATLMIPRRWLGKGGRRDGLPDPCATRVKLAELSDTTADSLGQLMAACPRSTIV